MDYRVVLKLARIDQQIKVTSLLEDIQDTGLYSSSYSRVESLKQQLDLPQFFEVCRVLNIDPGKLWRAAKSNVDSDNFDLSEIYLIEDNLLSLKISDDAMMGGPQYSISPGSKVWYKPVNFEAVTPGNLVVVCDSDNNLHVRLLINDLGVYKLKAWQTADFQTLVLQAPYRVVGLVKDITFKTD